MRDLEPESYTTATGALSDQREAYGRYLEIVDAQRAALGSSNVRVVTALAARLDGIIAEIQIGAKRLEPVLEAIERRSVDGPRTQALRDLMTATAADAAMAQAAVRDLTQRLVAGRDQAGKELNAAQSAGPHGRSGSPLSRAQPALIDAHV